MKILISGDSWGCGEWGYINGQYGILHRGLEQYFIDDGHTVKNVSKGGSSNKGSIIRLKNEIKIDTDYVIWFQTDPLRDCYVPDKKLNFKDFKEVMLVNDEKLLSNYNDLNDIDKTVYVIGGCGKINLDLILQFTNLVPLIPSAIEFLYPTFKHPHIWVSDFLWSPLYDSLNNDILFNILERKKIVDSLHFGPYQDYFQPDGRHPNRFGHYKIYEYFKNYCI